MADSTTNKPFKEEMADLLRENDFTMSTGNPNWHAFAAVLDDINYETLRKAVNGLSKPTPRLMEECARALQIKPTHFAEYRLRQAQDAFDPEKVGFEQAMRNWKRWTTQHEAEAPTARRQTRRKPS